MRVVTSEFTSAVPQVDGRYYVTETHTTDEGEPIRYEYLNDGSLDPQMVMEERAIEMNRKLVAREVARAAVTGTDVPMTRYEFLSRFTPTERVAIRIKSKTDAIVEDFMELLSTSGLVFLKLAQPGLNYLASIGVITAERAVILGSE
jgi:hypothetical protein